MGLYKSASPVNMREEAVESFNDYSSSRIRVSAAKPQRATNERVCTRSNQDQKAIELLETKTVCVEVDGIHLLLRKWDMPYIFMALWKSHATPTKY